MNIRIATLAILLAALPLAGCANKNLSEDFGKSVHQAVAAQTLNPGPASLEPVTGLDGQWAATAMENYRNAPQPAREVKANNLQSLFEVGGKQ
ncbi:MAG: hypothetical protein V3573_00515 [Desulfovibrionaceae bacterium]